MIWIFFLAKKVEKKLVKNGQPSSQNAWNRLGNKICLLFRAELRVKMWSKNAFFWGLDPKIGSKFPGPLGFFSLAREYVEVGEKN